MTSRDNIIVVSLPVENPFGQPRRVPSMDDAEFVDDGNDTPRDITRLPSVNPLAPSENPHRGRREEKFLSEEESDMVVAGTPAASNENSHGSRHIGRPEARRSSHRRVDTQSGDDSDKGPRSHRGPAIENPFGAPLVHHGRAGHRIRDQDDERHGHGIVNLLVDNLFAAGEGRATSTTASASSARERTHTGSGVPNVPPVSAGLQGRKETEQTAEPHQDDELLNRRTNRSDVSLLHSFMGSSTSVTPLSTVASTTSGSRRIIPLYNLSAHSVLQNTVQDAGTDATVSRFRKRGIEIIGLGTLEPVEVHGPMPMGAVAGWQPDFDPSDAGHRSNLGTGYPNQTIPHRLRRASQSYLQGRTSPSPPSPLREVYVPEELVKGPSKTFFEKLFKKKDPPSVLPSPGLLSPTMAPRASTTARPGLTQPQPRSASSASARPTSVYNVVPSSPATTMSPPTPTSPASYYQPPVLGTQATLRTDTFSPPSRPATYVWVLRRWTKGAGGLSGLGVGGVDMVRVGVKVRFEWVREKKKCSSPSPVRRPVSVASMDEGKLGIPESGSMRSTSPDGRSESGWPRSDSGRARSDSKRSAHPSRSDHGDESDPEDSETPWSCTLRIIPLHQSSSPFHTTPKSSANSRCFLHPI